MANLKDPFALRLWPERLHEPAKWRASRRVFVNSMSDLFHHDVPDRFLVRVFETMLAEDRHVYQVLTKRPARAMRFLRQHRAMFVDGLVPNHIWIGTSVEDQNAAFRVRQIQQIPAVIRFLSCEPLLGPLALDLRDIHWVIVGGESGVVHRPMDIAWARSLRDQCATAGVAFFFKQIGGRTPKANGRLLDGVTWDQYPVIHERRGRR